MSNYETPLPLGIDDPEKHVVGTITGMLMGTGVRLIAEHEGVTLWAEIFHGLPIDFRAFDPSGRELTVVVIRPPSSSTGRPQEGHSLRQAADPQTREADGGTTCAYVCTATSDGGSVCWKECR